jgi:hypothetical protein
MQLAIQALKRDATLTIEKAAQNYNVPRMTLTRRRAGTQQRRDCTPNAMKLTPTEEDVIVQYILDLDSRGYPPRLADVAAMANLLLAERQGGVVGQHWPNNFVNRRRELKVKLNRKYDYKRALCEDPKVIRDWFRLVANTKAKYGITDADTYNFDETGFMMGVISTGSVVTGSERRGRPKSVQPGNREWVTAITTIGGAGQVIPPYIVFGGKHHLSAWYKEDSLPQDWALAVSEKGWTTDEHGLEWVKYFHKHTKDRTAGTHRLLILDGHGSHSSIEFDQHCKDNNIITLCMPPHSSHLLQPLDVGCFSPLKKAYGRQAEALIRNRINHITKLEFLPCFIAAYHAAITKDNILGGFRGAGLIPFDPEAVIINCGYHPVTPEDLVIEEGTWESKTPSNTLELGSQSKLLRERLQRHVDSSPSSMVDVLEKLTKGAEMMAHSAVLIKKQVAELQAANEAATRRKSHKRKRIQKGGMLVAEEGARLTALKEFGARSDRKRAKKRVRAKKGEPSQRCCKQCGEAGHNSRTCKQ